MGKFDKKYQYSIFASVITGCIAYLYYVSHTIHNYDSIAIFEHGVGASVDVGRGMLNILRVAADKVCGNGGYFHTTVINTVIAVVLIELSCLLLIDIFELDKPLECIAITAVTIAYPVVGATMIFNYTVAFYMAAMFFSTLAVWFARRGKWWELLIASVLLALGLGIYQAYFPYGAALLVILLLQQTVLKRLTSKAVLLNSVKYFGVLITAYLIYMAGSKYYMWKLGITVMSPYQGIDQIGKIDLVKLPQLIAQAYRNFFSVTQKNYMSISAAESMQILFLGLYFCILAAGTIILTREYKNILRVIEVIIFLILFPVASDAITAVAPGSNKYTLMVMGMVTVFYLAVAICKGLPEIYNIQKIFYKTVCFIILIMGCFYCYQANANYTELFYMNERTENFFAVLYSRILSQPGYRADMDIVLVGENFAGGQPKPYDIGELRYGGNYFDENIYSRNGYLEIYFGKSCRTFTEEEAKNYKELLAEMEVYPDYSSIDIVDDMVIVKIEELKEE